MFQLSEVFKYTVIVENTARSPQKCTEVFCFPSAVQECVVLKQLDHIILMYDEFGTNGVKY